MASAISEELQRLRKLRSLKPVEGDFVVCLQKIECCELESGRGNVKFRAQRVASIRQLSGFYRYHPLHRRYPNNQVWIELLPGSIVTLLKLEDNPSTGTTEVRFLYGEKFYGYIGHINLVEYFARIEGMEPEMLKTLIPNFSDTEKSDTGRGEK